jgi:hypothetical protein
VGGGEAGWSASAERERMWASHLDASTSYAAWPISVISSVALERYTGSTPTCASVFPEQYQSRS